MAGLGLDTGFLEGLLVGLGLAGLAYGLLRWRSGRPGARGRPPQPPASASRSAPPLGTPPATPPSPGPTPDRTPAAAKAPRDVVLLSQRVVLHLHRFGGVEPTGDLGNHLTQAGIAAALSASQGSLSNALRRLEDGGAVFREKTHVRGRSKRVTVYRLTARGREIAVGLPRPASRAPTAPAGPVERTASAAAPAAESSNAPEAAPIA